MTTEGAAKDEWPQRIVKLVLIQQHIRDLDREDRYRYHLPRVPASEAELSAVERHLGHALDRNYGDFLRHANGWPCFLQWTDLFGALELLDAKRMRTASAELEACSKRGDLDKSGVKVEDLLAIGLTNDSFDPPPKGIRDVFALARLPSRQNGRVFWFAGELVDEFPNFTEFFLAMTDYNRQVFEGLAGE